MTDDLLLKQIGKLLDTALEPIKKQLGVLTAKATSHDKKFESIEKKLASHDKRFDSYDAKFKSIDERFDSIEKQIKQNQEETIDTLTELIETGYAMHEKRIKNIENHLHLPQPQE